MGSTVFTPFLTTSYQMAYGNIYSTPSDVYLGEPMPRASRRCCRAPRPWIRCSPRVLLPETALFDSATPVVSIPGAHPGCRARVDRLAGHSPSNPRQSQYTAVRHRRFGNPDLPQQFLLAWPMRKTRRPTRMAPCRHPSAGVGVASPSRPPTQPLPAGGLQVTTCAIPPNGLPPSPTLLCGGEKDPTVFFSVNTGTMQAFWLTTRRRPRGPCSP